MRPKGETTGFASWYADALAGGADHAAGLPQPARRQRRFFGVADDETLEALLAESSKDQQEVTDQLGYQVRRAVEVLIQSLDRTDQDTAARCSAGVQRDRRSTKPPSR